MSQRQPERWMWSEACEMLERAERLHRQFFQLTPGHGPMPTWEPPVDVVESPNELRILVALPGVPPEQVEVGVEGDTLVVTGVRPMPGEYRTARVHRLEIPHGRFQRRITLSGGRLELRQRDLTYGCLTLIFAKMT